MAGKKKRFSLWSFVDNLEGDKVVWMIVMILVMLSIVAIFSSTSLLAQSSDKTRVEILKEQVLTAAGGFLVMFVCCLISKIGVFKFFSKYAFLASLFPLVILFFGIDFGPLHPTEINSSRRVIMVGGVQFHVFEFVKVAMVMYLSWAVSALGSGSLGIVKKYGEKYKILTHHYIQLALYIFGPIIIVCLFFMGGSLSTTLFCGGVMFLTILIGGIKVKDILPFAGAALGVLLLCFAINAAVPSDRKKPFPHLDSAINRVDGESTELHLERIKTLPAGDPRFQRSLDKVKQPYGATIAIHEGGLVGKGPGSSSQRYVVPIMFEDFMFSFIVEEYGVLGAILVVILYISLLARGSIIVRNCENPFAKTAVAGLVILITGQAMLHMLVCCDIGILTGQPLPMVSHGKSSFLMFSGAFGIILSISKMAKRKIEREEAMATPLGGRKGDDDVEGGLADLDRMESGMPSFEEGGFDSDDSYQEWNTKH